MFILFLYVGWFLIPILSIIFCLNLVSIIKKVKNDENTRVHTFWLTTSFILITWSIAILASTGLY